VTPDEPRRDVTAPRDPEVPPPPDHDCLVSTTGTGNRPIDSAASLTTPTSGHGDQDGECHVRFRFDSVARNDVTSSSCTLPKEPHPVRDQTVYRRAPPPRIEAAEGRGCAKGQGRAKGRGRRGSRLRRGSRPPRVEAAPRVKAAPRVEAAEGQGRAKGRGRRGSRPPRVEAAAVHAPETSTSQNNHFRLCLPPVSPSRRHTQQLSCRGGAQSVGVNAAAPAARPPRQRWLLRRRQAGQRRDKPSSALKKEIKAEAAPTSKEIKAARQLGVIMGAFTVCFLPYFVCFTVVALCADCVDTHLMTTVTWIGYALPYLRLGR